MKIRPLFLPLLFTCAALAAADTKIGEGWSYEKLQDTADLIVIATPISNFDLDAKTVLPDIQQIGADGKPVPVPAVLVETNFEIQATLKGSVPLNRFFLHHYRLANPPSKPVPGGPQLVVFDTDKKIRYLMFLKKDADGHFYISAAGQTDPGIAISPLGTYP